MFTFLKEIDGRLYARYVTLERNIKAAGNSFYDAYLDLQEQFVRIALNEAGLDLGEGSSVGGLLKKPACRDFFLSTVGLDAHTYDKMQDYTLKVNAHKHKQEKHIARDTVLNYVTVLHRATAAYASYRGICAKPLDVAVYADMFGAYAKEHARLTEERDALREELTASMEAGRLKERDLTALRQLLAQQTSDAVSLEEQNAVLQEQISRLKDIKLSTLEEKLDRATDMLLTLQSAVAENRALSYAVGDTICGREMFEGYVARAKATLPSADPQP